MMTRSTLTLWLVVTGLSLPDAAWAQLSGRVEGTIGRRAGNDRHRGESHHGHRSGDARDKYEFAPTAGAFRGVRTFSRQIKHAAAVQHLVAATILGEKITADMADERGPDSIRCKAEVLQYLKESFVALKRAADTLDHTNALAVYKGPFGETANTRLGPSRSRSRTRGTTTVRSCRTLRMNGLTPPRTL